MGSNQEARDVPPEEEKTQGAHDRWCPVSEDYQVEEGLKFFHVPKGKKQEQGE